VSICRGQVSLRVLAAHEVNLGKVWAIFRKLPEGEESRDPYITLPGKHYSLSRATRASKVYLEACREKHLPGDYELQAVRAYPYELDGREYLIMEFDLKGEFRFRIAEELRAHSPKVTGWKMD
jgi:hypothetical protein